MTRSGYVLKLTEADHTCATCSASIRLPKTGERWWNTHTGQLYEIRSTPSEHEPWWGAHRVDAPETGYGCDPGVKAAVWLRAVREGHWHPAPAHVGVTPDPDQVLRSQGERNRLDAEAGWTPAHVGAPAYAGVAPDPDQARNLAREEEFARMRSERNHYRDKYLNDDRIPLADAEILRLQGLVEQMVTRDHVGECVEAAVVKETDRCAYIAAMYSNQIANAIRIKPGDPTVRRDYHPDVSLDDGRIPITGFASGGASEPEILRLRREVAAMRDSIDFCSGSCRLPAIYPEPVTNATGFASMKESDNGRRQDEGDGSERVPGVHGNDGTDLCEEPAEHAEESADDVGATVSRHSEPAGLLAGSGESDEKDGRGGVTPDLVGMKRRVAPRIWIVQNGSTWTVKMGVFLIGSFADEREALAVQTLLADAIKDLWPDPDEAKASYNQGFQRAAATVESFVLDERNAILAEAQQRQRDTKVEYKHVYERFLKSRSDPHAHHYSGDLENGRLLEAEHMCDFIRARGLSKAAGVTTQANKDEK